MGDFKIVLPPGSDTSYQVGDAGKGEGTPSGGVTLFGDGQSKSEGGTSTQGTPAPNDPNLPACRRGGNNVNNNDAADGFAAAQGLLSEGGNKMLQGAGYYVEITANQGEIWKMDKDKKVVSTKEMNKARDQEKEAVDAGAETDLEKGRIEKEKSGKIAVMKYVSGGVKLVGAGASSLIGSKMGKSKANSLVGAAGANDPSYSIIASDQTQIASRSVQGVFDAAGSVVEGQEQLIQGGASLATAAQEAKGRKLQNAQQTSRSWMDAQSRIMVDEEPGRAAESLGQSMGKMADGAKWA